MFPLVMGVKLTIFYIYFVILTINGKRRLKNNFLRFIDNSVK
jgi:hypothetical protein